MPEAISNHKNIKVLLAQLWEEKKPVTVGRIAVVAAASSALLNGHLSPELRAHAKSEAHKLAGSLGTFGFPEGSRLSRIAEETLKEERPLDDEDGRRLAELLRQLCQALEIAPIN